MLNELSLLEPLVPVRQSPGATLAPTDRARLALAHGFADWPLAVLVSHQLIGPVEWGYGTLVIVNMKRRKKQPQTPFFDCFIPRFVSIRCI